MAGAPVLNRRRQTAIHTASRGFRRLLDLKKQRRADLPQRLHEHFAEEKVALPDGTATDA
jgi:hypothetical protein